MKVEAIEWKETYMTRAPYLALLLIFTSTTQAKDLVTVDQAFLACKNKYPNSFEAKKRLACYDSIETPATIASDTPSSESTIAATDVENKPKPSNIAVDAPKTELSYLERTWRLTSEGDWDISDFEAYKANYLLVTSSTDPNNTPVSPTRPNTADRNLQQHDLKFQFSLKTQLMDNIPVIRNLPYVTSSRIWAAYTQQSYWQIFDGDHSRPLRENDYQPELILSLGIDNQVGDVRYRGIPRMLNLGLVHESNGSSDPLSRSWNRLYLESGWELSDNVSMMVRPWLRIFKDGSNDDNPDIDQYMGYGDMRLRWEDTARKNSASILLRNNLRSENKGFVQLDLQRKMFESAKVKLHLMLSSGYGESLLDYNHSQTTLGMGISLGE